MTSIPQVPVAFDPFEPGFVDSPYPQYARLRADDPVHWSPLLQGYVLTRYDHIAAVLRDPTISVELENAAPSAMVQGERNRMSEAGRKAETLVLRDDPDHARLRRLLQRPFSGRAVAGLADMVRQRTTEALDALVPKGSMDVITDFAYPLPVAVFCEMFGIPDEDSPRFRTWVGAVARNLDPVISNDERTYNLAQLDEMERYLEALIDEKRRAPTDDIMTVLVQAEEDGDRLTRDELVAQLVTLYIAGHEPTTSVIGNGLLALLRHPDQLALLQRDPDLLPGAIHELIRYDGPNQFVRRITTQEIDLDGTVVAPGQVLYCGVAAANRDPDHWGADVDVVDIGRADAVHHLQFGSGVHACLGAHLARLQTEVALGALLDRAHDIELADPPRWSERMVLRGLASLPIRFTPAG